MTRTHIRAAGAACALSLVLAVIGCSAEDADPAATATSGATGATSGPPATDPATATAGSTVATEPGELATGLLPAEAFGPGTSLQALAPEDLETYQPGRFPEGTVIDPPECAPSAESTLPEDVAGQVASAPEAVYVEQIFQPYAGTALDPALIADLFGGCETLTVTSDQNGVQVTLDITVSTLDLPEIGEDRVGLRIDADAAVTDTAPSTYTSLFGLATDGDRATILSLVGTTAAAVDEGAFGDLLAAAYDRQHDVLG